MDRLHLYTSGKMFYSSSKSVYKDVWSQHLSSTYNISSHRHTFTHIVECHFKNYFPPSWLFLVQSPLSNKFIPIPSIHYLTPTGAVGVSWCLSPAYNRQCPIDLHVSEGNPSREDAGTSCSEVTVLSTHHCAAWGEWHSDNEIQLLDDNLIFNTFLISFHECVSAECETPMNDWAFLNER